MIKRKLLIIFMAAILIALVITSTALPLNQPSPLTTRILYHHPESRCHRNGLNYYQNQKMTQAEREAAAERLRLLELDRLNRKLHADGSRWDSHYFGPYPNYANSPCLWAPSPILR